MRRRLAGPLVALAVGCGGGDEDACEAADNVAAEIRRQAELDGIMAPCADGEPTDNPVRNEDYRQACARYEELKEKCDG